MAPVDMKIHHGSFVDRPARDTVLFVEQVRLLDCDQSRHCGPERCRSSAACSGGGSRSMLRIVSCTNRKGPLMPNELWAWKHWRAGVIPSAACFVRSFAGLKFAGLEAGRPAQFPKRAVDHFKR
jgi:hypothetical protein